MSCSCTKQTFIAHAKDGLNVMPGQEFFWRYVCTKKYSKSRELTVKDKPKTDEEKITVFTYNSESNSHRKINDNRQ